MKNADKTNPNVPDIRKDALLRPSRSDEDPDRHLIRLQLARPPHERTNFLRVPLANGGSGI